MSFSSRLSALLLLMSFAGAALAAERSWLLRLEGMTTNYSSETFSASSLAYERLALDGGSGFAVAAELLLSPRFGLELSLGRLGLDADWERVEYQLDPSNPGGPPLAISTDADSGDYTLQPVAFSAYWHALRSERLDLYLGPQLAWVDYDVGLDGPPRRQAEWALGAKVGAALRLGRSPWSAGIALSYLEIQHEGEERDQYTGIGIPVASAVMTYRTGSREP